MIKYKRLFVLIIIQALLLGSAGISRWESPFSAFRVTDKSCLSPHLDIDTGELERIFGLSINSEKLSKTQYALDEAALFQIKFSAFKSNCDEKEQIVENIATKIGPLLPQYNAVLDIGAGAGEVLLPIIDRMPFKYFVAVEPNSHEIGKMKKTVREKCVIWQAQDRKVQGKIYTDFWQNVEQEIPDNKFDLIILSHVLYYIQISHIPGFIENVMRKLSPGGKIVIVLNSLERGKNQHGTYANLFSRLGDPEKAQLDPIKKVAVPLKEQGYQVSIEEIEAVVKTKSARTFRNALDFIILELPPQLRALRFGLRNYIRKSKQPDNTYTLRVPQDIIIVSEDNASASLPHDQLRSLADKDIARSI